MGGPAGGQASDVDRLPTTEAFEKAVLAEHEIRVQPHEHGCFDPAAVLSTATVERLPKDDRMDI